MRTCPLCLQSLEQTDYDGETVFRCAKCLGVFLPQYRLEIIRHKQQRQADVLKAEAKGEFSSDNKEKLHCPRCNGRMEKKPIDVRYATLTLDHCKSCDWIWLDGGELALAQLFFMSSARCANLREAKKRYEELEASPRRKT